jgi:anti-sigma regulatory factor (Ser/Thr protein kinase)
MTIQLPKLISLNFLSELLQVIKKQNIQKITFDWSEVENIADETIGFYLSFVSFLEQNTIDLIAENESQCACYQRIRNIQHCNILERTDFCKDIYVASVKTLEEQEQLRMQMKEFFRSCVPVGSKDIQPIDTIFLELFMNICQHSANQNGFVFMPFSYDNNSITLIMNDLGDGIVNVIRNYFTDETFNIDANVIQYATQDFITTKSTKNNQGRGLNILRTIMISIKGNGSYLMLD